MRQLEEFFQRKIRIAQAGENKFAIAFPMYKADGSNYEIYLVAEGGNFYFSDEGSTYAELDKIFEMAEPDVIKNIDAILKQYGCRKQKASNAFIIDCTPARLPCKIELSNTGTLLYAEYDNILYMIRGGKTKIEYSKCDSIISFGAYNWRVLETRIDKMLILSENVIERREYNKEDEYITWKQCTLRAYLNKVFYKTFSRQDRERILKTNVKTADNPWYGTTGGGVTTDKIFLLSIEEVVKYLGDSGDFKNRKGWYIKGEGADLKLELKDAKGHVIKDQYNDVRIAKNTAGKTAWWWLRSSGMKAPNVEDMKSPLAAFVTNLGSLFVCGTGVYHFHGGVRPALWLKL